LRFTNFCAGVLLALAAASPAAASDWRLVGRGGDVVHYVDAQSVARNGSSVHFMAQMVYLAPLRLDDGTEARRALVRHEADCGAMRGRIVRITLYLTGNRFDSWVDPSADEVAPPGSYVEAMYRAACNRAFEGATIADPAAHALGLATYRDGALEAAMDGISDPQHAAQVAPDGDYDGADCIVHIGQLSHVPPERQASLAAASAAWRRSLVRAHGAEGAAQLIGSTVNMLAPTPTVLREAAVVWCIANAPPG
jgi:hypothetical protein